MMSSETSVRVRYGETDKMGYVYYGNYPLYYEVARTEMIRNLGWTYKKMEENGIMMPVLSLNVKYITPAFYDDLLIVKTFVKELPNMRMHFSYEVYNEKNKLINIGETVLAFISAETMRPTKVPEELLETIKKHFK